MASIADLFVNIGADISGFKKQMKDMQRTLKGAGDKMKGIGEGMTKGVTAPLAAVGAIGIAAASDIEKGTGRIQASLGLTEKEAENLGDAAKELWQNAFGGSVDEVATAISTVTRNMQGLGQTESDIKKLTEQGYILQDTFGAEIGESTRAASVMMKNFGIDGTKAMDLITTGFQKGGDFSGELLDTMREYSPAFSSMGHSAEDMLGILIAGTEAGAWNLDKVGDAMKEFNVRAKDGSDTTADGFKAIGLNASEMGAAIAAGGDEGQKAFQATIAALAAMDDPIKRNQAGVALFGTQWEDLEADVVTAMSNGIGSINDVEGATAAAGEAIYNNIGTRATEVWRDFLAAVAPVGEVLVGFAENVLPPLSAALSTLAGWFDGLSPSMQTAVVVFGVIIAAIGPLLIFVGMLINGVAALIPLFTAVSAAIAAASVPIWPIIAVIAALIAIGILLYKNWDFIKANAVKIWGALKTFIAATLNGIKSVFNSVLSFVDSKTTGTFGGIFRVISSYLNTAKTVVMAFGTGIKNTFINTFAFIKALVNGDMQGMKAAISNQLSNIKTTFSTIFRSILSFIKGLGSSFLSAGRGLIDMMARGITGAIGKVTGAVKNVAQRVRNFLPFSPAKDGPLSDLDKLDFGGPMGDSLKAAIPKVSRLMKDVVSLPDIRAGKFNVEGVDNDNNQTSNPVNVTLNYSGNASNDDVLEMVDIIEKELYNRLNTKMMFNGVR